LEYSGAALISINSRRALTLAAVVGLLAIMEAAMLLSVRQESQTSDEAYSLLAGYLHLTTGDFSICPGYPPLTKDVAALPLLVFRPHIPPMTDAEASDFRGGRIFLYANRADAMLFAARAAMTVFPLLLALLVFLAAREMFGGATAFTALALIVFEPNLLAHGPLVTNDVALASCLFATVYGFWRYVVNPNAWRVAGCGIAAGLALAAKHSAIILFPIMLLLAMTELFAVPPATEESVPDENSRARSRGKLAVKLLGALAVVAAISLLVLWSFYAFRYSARPAGWPPSTTLASSLGAVRGRLTVIAITVAARAHLLPEAFLEGLAFFRATDTRPTYLFGRLYSHGVWFYFPAAMVVKSTLGFLLLLALAPLARPLWALDRRRATLWMLIPAAVFLLASMTSTLNIGLRHILPVYPFLAILAAAGSVSLAQRHRAGRIIVTGLVLFHAVSGVRAFPNYLAYSNELWGGPSKTYRVLTDSNVDWGQGLPAVKRYLDRHAATPCWLAYFGTVDPAHFEIPCTLLPATSSVIWERPLDEVPEAIEGTVLVSATEMSGQAWGPGELNPYEPFRTSRPVDCVAGSILVYQGKFQVPLASALSRLGKAVALANRGDLDAALAEARAAELLAPRSVDVQFVLGRLLEAAGRGEESRQAFENGLRLARTIQPEWQAYWIPIIAEELAKP
jgi:4-amino-4-deoxy-L-arabinose transferase-like glycosyltransferase